MAKSSLAGAVEKFSAVTHSFTDQDLEKEWAWGAYDEGVRFAFFRVYEDLRELAARVAAQRSVEGPAMTTAQFILAGYHSAYRDLQAVLIGLSDEQAVQEPADEQWPIVQVVLHIVQAESAFYAVNHYAVKRLRTKEQVPLEMSDETWLAYQDADNFEALKENQSFSGIMDYYDELHWRVISEFADIQETEIEAPAVFWESEPMPVEFRLHRFDSHLRQHTVQVEKTLDLLGLQSNEPKQLLRLIYTALAEVESAAIGAPGFGLEPHAALAEKIARLADEIEVAVKG